MKKNSYSGKFIVFEGLDGSGQSTQANLLKNFLIEQGLSVILTKEPTLESEAGKKIRKILDKKEKTSPKNLQELFTEDRKEHLKKLIIPALKKRKIVISDRYFFSSFAYGAADGLDLEWLIKINNQFLLPDLIFFLKVNSEICIQRIEKRGDPKTLFEKKKRLENVWQVYEALLNRFENIYPAPFTKGGGVYLIDGEKPIEDVFSQVKKIILQLLNNKNR